MNGYIVKGIGGFYYVKTPDGIVECKPRGIFRKQKITPVAGDEVTLETENGAAVIAQIAPRKNVFVRPPVANLDVLFLVASTTQPTPSTLVLDKLSAIAVDKGVQPVVVCTKSDLAEADFLANAYAKSTLPFIRIDYESGTGLDEVKQWINGRLCAFCGNSGVGKSTLLNLLAGFDRAIVTPVAGTTRDVVEQAVRLGDIRLNLFDTAGLRDTEDVIEAEGIRRSWKKLDEAGLVLAVFDGSEPLTREDLALARKCAGRPAIALINKEDKPTRFDAEVIAPYFAMVLPVCCQEEGARKLIASAVARLLGTNQIDPHAASLSGQRQLAAATRAREAVAGALEAAAGGFGLDAVSVCVDDALDALCDLTGENASEAVINEVFERFCVGK